MYKLIFIKRLKFVVKCDTLLYICLGPSSFKAALLFFTTWGQCKLINLIQRIVGTLFTHPADAE